jgi:dihydropteroate synthase
MVQKNRINQSFHLNLNGELLRLMPPVVMGILNVTPDSFYDGGFHNSERSILEKTEKMLADGASIIDIGGYSTRPMADEISVAEEINRVLPTIKLLVKKFNGIKISVDTFRSKVASLALNEGACMINDISGGELDVKMWDVLAEFKPVYVLMHSRGNPQTMQGLTTYEDLIWDVTDYFQKKISLLLDLGLRDIVIDPGFGFAKTIEQNFELFQNIPYLQKLNMPIMVGVSRKSMIYKSLGLNSVESLNGTTVLNTLALSKGADILRVHDVKEAMEAIKLWYLIQK